MVILPPGQVFDHGQRKRGLRSVIFSGGSRGSCSSPPPAFRFQFHCSFEELLIQVFYILFFSVIAFSRDL